MLNCHEITRLHSESLERPLLMKEKMSLKFHCMMCKGCRNFGLHMHDIRAFSRAYRDANVQAEKKHE